ncbi:unnamed protein product [Sphagnum troendelagicum]|uniref:Ribosomal protein n=1 Tax=Sphagnum troendelagicum TaxID=128251 RepID=A0ABP0TYM6_9BRYO
MKVRAAVRRMCEYCKVVKRRNRVFILCTVNPKHKQRQGFSDLAYDSGLPSMPFEHFSQIPKLCLPRQSLEASESVSGLGAVPGVGEEGVGLASLLPKS